MTGRKEPSPAVSFVVFARSPLLGAVKTRLAADIGAPAALAVYRRLLRHSIRMAIEATLAIPDAQVVISHLGPAPRRELPPRFAGRLEAQPGPDMADNLQHCFRCLAREDRRIVVFGVDHPYLEASQLLVLANLLERSDAVIGPASDGGFWAVGARRALAPETFRLPLGGAEAGVALEARLTGQGLTVGHGPALADIDTLADYRRWLARIAPGHPRLAKP